LSEARYPCPVDIAEHARKHGVTDENMLHAIRNAVRTVSGETPRATLYLGPDYNGNMLEVVVLEDDPDEEPVVIHAMRMRRKYLLLLRRG